MDKRDPLAPHKFAKPIILAEVTYTHFKLRDPTIDDMFTAELEAARTGGGTHTPLQFNGHMMVLQMDEVSNEKGDSFKGPFTMSMLKKWGPRNYGAIREVQLEIDKLGEADSSEQSQD